MWEIRFADRLYVIGYELGHLGQGHLTKMYHISSSIVLRAYVRIWDIWEIRYGIRLYVIRYDLGHLGQGHLAKMYFISLIIALRA